MRDKRNYRAQNGRSQAPNFTVVCLTTAGGTPAVAAGRPRSRPARAPIPPSEHVVNHPGAGGDEWMAIHCNGMDAC